MTRAPLFPGPNGEWVNVFTAGFDAVQNVLVGVQVSIKDKPHGELCENKTQLRRKREKVETHHQVLLQMFQRHAEGKRPPEPDSR